MNNQQGPSSDQFWDLFAKKLAKEASPGELENLHNLLINNPDLQYQADLISEMWQQSHKDNIEENEAAYMRHLLKYKNDLFAETASVDVINEQVEIDKEPARNFRKIFSGRKVIIMTLVAVLVISTGIFLLTKKTDAPAQESQAISSVVTKNGNRTKIVLPDGTQVWLNAGSKIDYDDLAFNKTLREVSLNGEAFFDVTKNPEKPFIIHTRKMDIKVVGTAFNVRSYNEEKFAEAALIRGSIEVTLKDRKNQKLILKPNEKISISTEEAPIEQAKQVAHKSESAVIPQILVKKLQPNPKINIISEIAWTQNKLCFEDEDLESISLMLERWYGKKIIIANDSLKKLRYTGNFEKETMEEILSYLKLSKPFNFKTENNAIVIY